ncbi:MAG TPA: RNA polymerase factor sigma-54 [Candidatus Hydrogenedens sp.]|nr:RNA polymerase factor sigma-54 [Candidatus Hydrogenedens sp.]
MKLEARQTLQQRQELQLSLFQTQSLQILQMPIYELEQYIHQEADGNPLIELEYHDLVETPTTDDLFETENTSTITETTPIHTRDEPDIDDENDYEYEQEEANQKYFDLEKDDDRYKNPTNLSYNPDIDEWAEKRFANQKYHESLRSFLIKQLRIDTDNEKEIEIGESIIASIDQRGYFVGDIEEIAKAFNTSTEDIEKILKKIQSLDPPGVGARDLKECLLIQVKRLFPDNPFLQKLIEEYHDEIIHRQILKIAKGLNIKPHEVEELIKLLRDTLNPYPGHEFAEEPEYIIPDIIVKINEEDEITIELEDKITPSIKIVETIPKEQIKRLPSEDKDQLRKYKESAIRLIKCIDLRNSTLYRVAKEIVTLQEDFIRNGVEYLKPMTYKDISSRLGIHESTISRCIAKKYMSTPQGIFELKYFFTGGKKSETSEKEISSRTIKTIIQRIIDEEDKSKPLSDQQIAEQVQKQEGIKIARRTVTKYREEMNIPNAFERKVYSK